MFDEYIGIDYSGADAPTAGLPGLRVFVATPRCGPAEVRPHHDARRHWSRRTLAAWLTERLAGPRRAVVGIDHGFSFPLAYFDRHDIPRTWPAFLDDFARHWPTDVERVEDVRRGGCGDGAARGGDARWRRQTDVRAGGAKSVFHFDVPGSVAKSTHAGLPWLARLRAAGGDRVHVWPFDGWHAPASSTVVAEVYPSRWRGRYRRSGRTDDQQDAYVVAAWLREADRGGHLAAFLEPALDAPTRAAARVEGWILGVP